MPGGIWSGIVLQTANQKHRTDVVCTTAAERCDNFEALSALGFTVNSRLDAENIIDADYRGIAAEEKAALHREAGQDLHKPSARTAEGPSSNTFWVN
jgi:hypothetical protein